MNEIEYNRDQLDKLVRQIEPSLSNLADYNDRRDLAFSIVMGEYNQELIEKNDDHVIDDNFSSPLSTGTAVVDTTIGDLFKISLPSGQFAVMGDVIFLQKGTGTFFTVNRKPIAEIIVGGSDETLHSFASHRGSITLYAKEGQFASPGLLAYFFYRVLDTALPIGTTVLDIKATDFNTIAQRVSEYMLSN